MDATAIRAGLGHPVVDADGHIIEYVPAIRDLIGDDAGGAVADRFTAVSNSRGAPTRPRHRHQARQLAWPARAGGACRPATPYDRATAMLPGLLYERLDELGIDVAVLYPTVGLTVMALDDDELRRAVARACNRYYAEAYGPYSDRLADGRGHPDLRPGRGHRRARPRHRRARAEGLPVRRARAAVGPRATTATAPPDGSTASGSTASTTTTRSGSDASSSASPRPSTPPASGSGAVSRRPTTSPTTSATSPPAPRPCAARCSSVER